jgi:hypothetical protein
MKTRCLIVGLLITLSVNAGAQISGTWTGVLSNVRFVTLKKVGEGRATYNLEWQVTGTIKPLAPRVSLPYLEITYLAQNGLENQIEIYRSSDGSSIIGDPYANGIVDAASIPRALVKPMMIGTVITDNKSQFRVLAVRAALKDAQRIVSLFTAQNDAALKQKKIPPDWWDYHKHPGGAF